MVKTDKKDRAVSWKVIGEQAAWEKVCELLEKYAEENKDVD